MTNLTVVNQGERFAVTVSIKGDAVNPSYSVENVVHVKSCGIVFFPERIDGLLLAIQHAVTDYIADHSLPSHD